MSRTMSPIVRMSLRTMSCSAAALALSAGLAHAEFRLHVLHTNDFHSRVEPVNKYDSTCDAETQAKNECFGGSARLATAIARVRAEAEAKGEPVILSAESNAGQAYDDAVARLLGQERPMRFTTHDKKGFFSKLFGG